MAGGGFPGYLAEPARNPYHRLPHLLGGTRIAEADERAAMDRIEIDAGGGCDTGLFQHRLGELKTVGGKIGYVGVEVKCAIRRQELGEAGARPPLDQDAA